MSQEIAMDNKSDRLSEGLKVCADTKPHLDEWKRRKAAIEKPRKAPIRDSGVFKPRG